MSLGIYFLISFFHSHPVIYPIDCITDEECEEKSDGFPDWYLESFERLELIGTSN